MYCSNYLTIIYLYYSTINITYCVSIDYIIRCDIIDDSYIFLLILHEYHMIDDDFMPGYDNNCVLIK